MAMDLVFTTYVNARIAENLVSGVRGCCTAPAGRGSGAASGPGARAASRRSPAGTGPGAGHEPLAPASRVTFPFSRPHRAISGKPCLLPCISASVRRNVTPCPVTTGEDAPPCPWGLPPAPGEREGPSRDLGSAVLPPPALFAKQKTRPGNRAGPLRGRVDAYLASVQTRVCLPNTCAFFVGPIE